MHPVIAAAPLLAVAAMVMSMSPLSAMLARVPLRLTAVPFPGPTSLGAVESLPHAANVRMVIAQIAWFVKRMMKLLRGFSGFERHASFPSRCLSVRRGGEVLIHLDGIVHVPFPRHPIDDERGA